MEFNLESKPNRRFLFRLGVAAAIVVLSDLAADHLIGKELISGSMVWALAIVPGVAMVGIFYAYIMLIIEQKDEFIRMLILRQFVIGSGIALSCAAVWGSLEKFGLVEHVYPFYFVFAFIVGFAIGGLVNRVTRGAWGEMS